MPKTDLKLKTINANSGAKINTTITYVNGSASSGTLKQYAQLLNGLTNNIYSETDRIQTINVDTEEVPVPAFKQVPTFTMGTPAYTDVCHIPFSYDGDGEVKVAIMYLSGSTWRYDGSYTYNATNHEIVGTGGSGAANPGTDNKMFVVMTETDNCYSAGLYVEFHV